MLFNITVYIKYYLKTWKEAIILALQKSNKEDYTVVKAYCSITFLNTIEKLLELIISYKLLLLTKSKALLL
jgi:hypothetical protein